MKCSGCNKCNQSKAVVISLSPAQLNYLVQSGLIQTFNETVAIPAERKTAKLGSRKVVFGAVTHLRLFVNTIPIDDLERIEVRGILAEMKKVLKQKVFAFPLTVRDEERLESILSDMALSAARNR